MSVLKNANVACLCRLIFPCPLSNSRNCHVPCHYLFGPHVAVAKVHVTMLNLRNGHVALLMLGVYGHYSGGVVVCGGSQVQDAGGCRYRRTSIDGMQNAQLGGGGRGVIAADEPELAAV